MMKMPLFGDGCFWTSLIDGFHVCIFELLQSWVHSMAAIGFNNQPLSAGYALWPLDGLWFSCYHYNFFFLSCLKFGSICSLSHNSFYSSLTCKNVQQPELCSYLDCTFFDVDKICVTLILKKLLQRFDCFLQFIIPLPVNNHNNLLVKHQDIWTHSM